RAPAEAGILCAVGASSLVTPDRAVLGGGLNQQSHFLLYTGLERVFTGARHHHGSEYHDGADQTLHDGGRRSVYLGPTHSRCGVGVHPRRHPVLYRAAFRGAGSGGWRCEELSRGGRGKALALGCFNFEDPSTPDNFGAFAAIKCGILL